MRSDELRDVVSAMSARLEHRGPDDDGLWLDPSAGIGLGHRRLAIIELSEAGAQPMISRDGRFTIVFNGEIYNYRSIRDDLAAAGVRFRGSSDTEVLLEGIAHWGLERTVARLDGMFAFGVWNVDDHLLHLVRDRFGEKPLCWGWDGDRLLFASELHAIESVASRLDLRTEALEHVMARKCIPAPLTIYEQFHKLEPGTILTVDSEGVATPDVYWSAIDTALASLADPLELSMEDAVRELTTRLQTTVASRMVADVEVGCFLSGGVDSAGIAAFMQQATSATVRTFTIGFDDVRYDESAGAAAVARRLGTKHTELKVTPTEAMQVIPDLATIYDEPFADSSQIPSVLVSRLATQHVKVVLTGDGGDEVFGGYNRHVHGARVETWRRVLPSTARRYLGNRLGTARPEDIEAAFDRIRPLLPPRLRMRLPADKLAKFGRAVAAPHLRGAYDVLTRDTGVEGAVRGTTTIPPIDDSRISGFDFPTFAMLLDATSYLPSDILAKVDRASMSASLETRAPYLDPSLFEFAWRLPAKTKIRGGVGKLVLREAIQAEIGDFDLSTVKQGFGIPVGDWLRGPLRDWGEEHVRESAADDAIFDQTKIEMLWSDHQDGVADRTHKLWSVLTTRAWLRAREAIGEAGPERGVAHG